jgi:hypothetical protein
MLVGALPVRRFPVCHLRLRQVRVLWVFNCNELIAKELIDSLGHKTGDAILGVRHDGSHDIPARQ